MEQWTRFHPAVFLLTYCAYVLYHVARKTISYVKSSMVEEWTPRAFSEICDDFSWRSCKDAMFRDKESAEAFVGLLNATFLFVYAAGLYLSGMLADRLNLRLFLTAGMVMSSLTIFVLGPVLEWTHTHSKAAYLILMVTNGLCQSTGWPCVVAVMTSWFGKNRRGLVMGLWCSSPSVGSMLGALIVSAVVDYGYDYAFLLSSSSLFAGSVVIFFGLVTSPREVGLPMPDERQEKEIDVTVGTPSEIPQSLRKRRSVPNLLCSPGWVTFDLELFERGKDDTQPHVHEKDLLRRKSLPQTFFGSTWSTDQREKTSCPDRPMLSRSLSLESVSSVPFSTHSPDKRSDESLWLQNHDSVPNHLAETGNINSAFSPTGDTFKISADTKEKEKGRYLYQKGIRADFKCPRSELRKAQQRLDLKSSSKYNGDKDAGVSIGQDTRETRVDTDRGKTIKAKRNKDARKRKKGHSTEADKYSQDNTNTPSDSRPIAINFFHALFLPGVIPYSLAHACIKMTNYVFFFWLPFYLVSSTGWTVATAGKLSIYYDVGGVVGGTVAGVLSNRFNKQALVVAPMLLLGVPALYLYSSLPAAATSLVVNGALLVLLGSLIGGVANIISAAIVADLGQQPAIRGSVEALSTVAGIVEGTGTLGAALGQLAVPYLNVTFGWPSVFYLMMAAIVLTVINVMPIIVAEVKESFKDKHCSDQD